MYNVLLYSNTVEVTGGRWGGGGAESYDGDKAWSLYGGAVYFFLAGDDLQQREWIFRSSVMGQEA